MAGYPGYPQRYYPPDLASPGIWGDIWGEIKKIPGEIKKVDIKDIEKLGAIIGSFQKGKKGGKGGVAPPPVQYQFLPPSPVPGISTVTLLLLVGGAGLVIYLLLRK